MTVITSWSPAAMSDDSPDDARWRMYQMHNGGRKQTKELSSIEKESEGKKFNYVKL